MRKFIDKITPSFILAYNARLLKNAPLGWQLQLPVITWIWMLISVLTLPIPFLIHLDTRGDDDIIAVILITVLTAVLEGILFTYILIQFNNTKTFGHRVLLNGFKEHFGYFYVFMLCMLNIIFYPVIVDIRKNNLMTAEEIRSEAVVYNQASFYFMGDTNAYRYFPSEASFLHYNYLEEYRNYDEARSNYESEIYYIEKLKPLMQPYFSGDSNRIDAKYTRNVSGCPKLYMINRNHIDENYYNYGSPFYKAEMDTLYYDKYQLQHKSDAERLKDISAFIHLYSVYTKKYNEGYSEIHFDTPEKILQQYNSNRFSPVFYEKDVISRDYPVTTVEGEIVSNNLTNEQLSSYRISSVHSAIAGAGYYKWQHCVMRLLICFFVGLGLSILLYAFKNVRLKEFILMFVYTGLLTLVVTIINVLFHGKEDFPVHVVLVVFFLGIYFSFFDQNQKHFSSIKTIFILLSNLAFAFAPAALFIYFHEYHDIGKIPDEYEYCVKHAIECEKHNQMVELIRYSCLWGGILMYMLLGTTLYKKVYERLWALPFAK